MIDEVIVFLCRSQSSVYLTSFVLKYTYEMLIVRATVLSNVSSRIIYRQQLSSTTNRCQQTLTLSAVVGSGRR